MPFLGVASSVEHADDELRWSAHDQGVDFDCTCRTARLIKLGKGVPMLVEGGRTNCHSDLEASLPGSGWACRPLGLGRRTDLFGEVRHFGFVHGRG